MLNNILYNTWSLIPRHQTTYTISITKFYIKWKAKVEKHGQNQLSLLCSMSFVSVFLFMVCCFFLSHRIGLKTILVIYLHSYMKYSEDLATSITHAFVFGAYACGILGGWLSDAHLGMFCGLV